MNQNSSYHLRPFDASRDLQPVADLIEQCFAQTLDPDGQRFVRRMRTAAQDKGLAKLAAISPDWAGLPLNGYVCEADGQVVGNASLLTYFANNQRNFLIANVAVRPEYRRKGIARALTMKVLEHARKWGASSVWLHVREENEAALSLYQSLGFVEHDHRTTWFSNPVHPPEAKLSGLAILPPDKAYWAEQQTWLKNNYPADLRWSLSFNPKLLNPGIQGALLRLFTNADIHQWAALTNDRLAAVLSWQAMPSHADALWLAAPVGADEGSLHALLVYVRLRLPASRTLKLEYPARQSEQAIREAGFTPHQTLIWMSTSLRK